LVAGVVHAADLERQAAAAYALVQAVAQALQLVDALVQPLLPDARHLLPVAARGHMPRRQPRQLRGDLLQREAHALRNTM
jgi:hypothetical protein